MSTGAEYAGDITPEKAMEVLTATEGAVLVDVRTTAEWTNIGVPDLVTLMATPVFLEWQIYPTMAPNPDFRESLAAELKRRGAGTDTPVLFLCRSGARSAAAARAMTALGHSKSFNIAGGFEGSPALGLPGWKAAGLPWKHP